MKTDEYQLKLSHKIFNCLDNFYFSALVLPLILWGLIYVFYSPINSMDTKKVLRIIWMWGVIFIMLNWLIASTLMHLLKIKRIDTFIQVNGRNQLLDTATLLNLSQRKGLFARYAIYYLVQFKFMVMIGFGWTILGGLIVYVLTSKPF
jgi:hypothetical protein